MKMDDWLKLIKGKKPKSFKEKLTAVKHSDTHWELKQTCKCCAVATQRIKIYFHAPKPYLTLFEAELLYLLFVKEGLPASYAQFHKCEAGKEFILMLDRVEVKHEM